ncbi:MAG: toll/interleukin-1 receptor domain-containing protein [Verrucomicrobiales bacterium]
MKPAASETGQLKTIFVCYSRADTDSVNAIVSPLTQKGHCFWIDRTGIVGSETWRAKIVEALRNCDAVLFFGSRSSYASRHVATELTLAEEARKPIVPVLLDDSPLDGDMPYFLARLHRLKWHGNAPDRLLDEIHRALCSIGSDFGPPVAAMHSRQQKRRFLPSATGLALLVAAGLAAWKFVPLPNGDPVQPLDSAILPPRAEPPVNKPLPVIVEDQNTSVKPDQNEIGLTILEPLPRPIDESLAAPADLVTQSGNLSAGSDVTLRATDPKPPEPAPRSPPPPSDPAPRPILLWLKVGQAVEVIEPIRGSVLTKKDGSALVLDIYYNRGAKLKILEITRDRIMLLRGASEDAWLKNSEAATYLKPLP